MTPLSPNPTPAGAAPAPPAAPPLTANPPPLFSWQQVTLPGAGQSARPRGRPARRSGKSGARQRARSAQPARRSAGGWGGRRGSAWSSAASPGSSPAAPPAGTPQVSRESALRGGWVRRYAGAQRRKECGGPFTVPVGGWGAEGGAVTGLPPRRFSAPPGVALDGKVQLRGNNV